MYYTQAEVIVFCFRPTNLGRISIESIRRPTDLGRISVESIKF